MSDSGWKTAAFAVALAFAVGAATAQTDPPASGSVTGGSGTADAAGDVSAATSGTGTMTPDGVAVTGAANAAAADGGTATSRSDAQIVGDRAMARSTASARDDDDRARSRTKTQVQKDDAVRSRSMSIAKEKGERPVIERCSTIAGADGTVTTKGDC